MFRSYFSITALTLLVTGLTGCATVPLPGKGFTTPQPVRPVKPLMEGREGTVSQKTTSTPSAKPGTQPGAKPDAKSGVKPGASAQSGQTVPDSRVAPKLQEAEDKAASARSLSQSAQTEDDWILVAQQWKRALALLPNPAPTSQLSGKVQQARSTYTSSLQSAQANAQGKPTATVPLEIDRNSSGRRGMILGTEASPSPSAAPTDKPGDKPVTKPADKPNDKPTEPPKNNPTPSAKN